MSAISFSICPYSACVCVFLHDPKVLLCLDRTNKQRAKDIEGVPDLLDDILRLQGRCTKLLKRCEKAGAPEPHGPETKLWHDCW